MSRGVNKAVIIGYLGQDPETRYTASGAAITTISVATSEEWKDKTTGELKKETEWHRIKFFGRLAEIAGEYLVKGGQVYVEGRIKTDKYTDKEGIERYATGIIANELQMLGSKGGGGQPNQRDSERAERAATRGGNDSPPSSRGGGQPPVNDIDEDSIPFN